MKKEDVTTNVQEDTAGSTNSVLSEKLNLILLSMNFDINNTETAIIASKQCHELSINIYFTKIDNFISAQMSGFNMNLSLFHLYKIYDIKDFKFLIYNNTLITTYFL